MVIKPRGTRSARELCEANKLNKINRLCGIVNKSAAENPKLLHAARATRARDRVLRLDDARALTRRNCNLYPSAEA